MSARARLDGVDSGTARARLAGGGFYKRNSLKNESEQKIPNLKKILKSYAKKKANSSFFKKKKQILVFFICDFKFSQKKEQILVFSFSLKKKSQIKKKKGNPFKKKSEKCYQILTPNYPVKSSSWYAIFKKSSLIGGFWF